MKRKSIAVLTILLISVTGLLFIWQFADKQAQEKEESNGSGKQAEEKSKEIEFDKQYPGAYTLTQGFKENPELTVPENVKIKPDPAKAGDDQPASYSDECHQRQGNPEVKKCSYGTTDNATYTVAIVGSSHSAQWLPTLKKIGNQESIEVVSITKSACRFTTSTDVEEDCQQWNDRMIDKLAQLQPDLVFTTADVGSSHEVPEGYLEQFRKLAEKDLEVFGIRDNAWFDFDPAACVEENGADSQKCTRNLEDILPEEGPWETLDSKLENVYYYDASPYLYPDRTFKPVIGNTLVHRDNHHISATYAATLAPILKPELMKVLKETADN